MAAKRYGRINPNINGRDRRSGIEKNTISTSGSNNRIPNALKIRNVVNVLAFNAGGIVENDVPQ
jgi:hypothetical protein